MIVLDGTIVNVALPSIRDDLGFSQTSLAWVVNAYLLTFGGFLLLGGRLGDLFGHRRMFLIGARDLHGSPPSAAGSPPRKRCSSRARAVQGIGGAIVSAVALSLLMTLFTEQVDRAKAMGVFGFVALGRRRDRGARSAGSSPTCSAGIGSSSSTSRSACWSTSSPCGCFRPRTGLLPPAASITPARLR